MTNPKGGRPGPARAAGDFDDDVPLERDEEIGHDVASHHDEDDQPPADAVVELLFKTRIHEVKPKPPVTVPREASAADACRKMRENRVGSVLVMDGARIAGIFTERDVLYKVALADRRPAEIRIEEVMTPDPTTLKAGHRLAHALNKMSVDGCRHIPIVDDDGRPLGVVSVRRIVDFLVEQFPARLLTLPPDPGQSHGRAEGG